VSHYKRKNTKASSSGITIVPVFKGGRVVSPLAAAPEANLRPARLKFWSLASIFIFSKEVLLSRRRMEPTVPEAPRTSAKAAALFYLLVAYAILIPGALFPCTAYGEKFSFNFAM